MTLCQLCHHPVALQSLIVYLPGLPSFTADKACCCNHAYTPYVAIEEHLQTINNNWERNLWPVMQRIL
jgi:hypothetical protein